MRTPPPTESASSTDFALSRYLVRVKQKVSSNMRKMNAQIQIIHRMRKVWSGP